jgi:4-oxalomesaconate hydratase
MTFGERSESGGLHIDVARPSLEEVKEIRREEAMRAAGILRADIGFLDWGDLRFEYSPQRVGAAGR